MECGGMERKNLPVQLKKKNIYIVSLSSEIDVFCNHEVWYNISSFVQNDLLYGERYYET